MKHVNIYLCLLFIQWGIYAKAQNNGNEQGWPAECKKVEIISSADHTPQYAYFFQVKSNQPRPLVVKLHAWSSDYAKVDNVAQLCIDSDYNYINPDFRGGNDHPEACGSPLVIQDINDAIDYAIANANVDTTSIHIIGGSGGGYATLLCYMKIKRPIKTFTAWASITNLVDYYYECVGRKEKYEKYAHDLEKVTSGLPKSGFVPYFNETEAVKRSPIFMDTPVNLRKNSKLFIYAGIHDGGLSGDVPFIHSLKMFNKIVSDFDYSEQTALFSTEEMLRLLDWQTTKSQIFKDHLSVLIQRQYLNKIQINLFEGGHEMISERMLDGVNSQNIVILSDSNGVSQNGWVERLKRKRFSDFIYSVPVSGDILNCGSLENEENLLNQVESYVNNTEHRVNKVDKVIIDLGTANYKSICAGKSGTALQNIKFLLERLKLHPVYQMYHPEIFVMIPPPYTNDTQSYKNLVKIAKLSVPLKKIVEEERYHFINIYADLLPVRKAMTSDCIGLSLQGETVANIINDEIEMK
jgi:hypothetical protein